MNIMEEKLVYFGMTRIELYVSSTGNLGQAGNDFLGL